VIYLIGGPPRCGKTSLAIRLVRQLGIPLVGTDLIREHILPLVGEQVSAPTPVETTRLRRLSPLFDRFLTASVEGASKLYGDAVVEGEMIVPSQVAGLSARFEIRALFLGRTRASVADLIQPNHDNWLEALPLPDQEAVAAEVVGHSGYLKSECARLQIPFLEMSDDFPKALDRGEQILLGSPG
jgi:hypothetical protein